jgi:hypothetical protein
VGKASSSKKVQRAARAAASSRGASERRELGFPLTIAAVVILGVVLVIAARSEREPLAPPTTEDHWHAAYAIYDCDTVYSPFQSQSDPQGIHSHQDGVIHIHPFGGGAAGENAQLQVFLDAMGVTVTEDGISGPGIDLEAGSECNGEPTVIRVARFNSLDLDEPPEVFSEDFGSIQFLSNFEAFTVARVPDGAEIPPPPDDRIETARAASGGPQLSTDANTDVDPSTLADDPIVPEGADRADTADQNADDSGDTGGGSSSDGADTGGGSSDG